VTFDPANPGAAGYALKFSEDFTDVSRFDLNNTGAPGFSWYMDRQYWATPAPPTSVSLTPDGLVLTDTVATCGLSGARGSPMLGKAWGGGAYFEAEIMFSPDQVFVENGDWPSFYGLSWELAGDTDWAPGQPSAYRHWGELDIMEYGFFNHVGHPADYRFFWQIVHDWFGATPNVSGIQNNNVAAYWAGNSADIRGWHKYGTLWIPGAPTSNGSVQAFFDDQPATGPSSNGIVTYPYGKGCVTPPTSAMAYSVFDNTHFGMVLQSSLAAPMTVKSVKVWQLPSGTQVGV
jgi:hypothetical protein